MAKKKDEMILDDKMYMRSVQKNPNTGLLFINLPGEAMQQMGVGKGQTVCVVFRPSQMLLEIRPESEQLKFKPKKEKKCPTKNSSEMISEL